jgi:protein gp37
MAANSKIEWTDHTFNPWIGCTKVSPGCANCYAESENNRRKWAVEGWGRGKPRHRTSQSNWDKVYSWNAQAKNAVERPRVFCASLADWLDNEVPITWLADLLLLIDQTPNLDWLLLTKRPENFEPRMQAIFDSGIADCRVIVPDLWLNHRRPPENVWFGVSVEVQQRANERIPELLKIPARLRWLSCEPLLGPLNLEQVYSSYGTIYDVLYGYEMGMGGGFQANKIDWVVAGGESGPNARGLDSIWVRSLRDQCKRNKTPFFFKQWGEWLPPGQSFPANDQDAFRLQFEGEEYRKLGKKLTGRLLDGVEHNQFPEVH